MTQRRDRTSPTRGSLLSARPRKADGLQLHEVEDGYIVCDSGGETVHHLNHTAALVVELCTGSSSVAEIIDLVKETWQLRDPPERDVLDLLTRMADEGLIVSLRAPRAVT